MFYLQLCTWVGGIEASAESIVHRKLIAIEQFVSWYNPSEIWYLKSLIYHSQRGPLNLVFTKNYPNLWFKPWVPKKKTHISSIPPKIFKIFPVGRSILRRYDSPRLNGAKLTSTSRVGRNIEAILGEATGWAARRIFGEQMNHQLHGIEKAWLGDSWTIPGDTLHCWDSNFMLVHGMFFFSTNIQ